MTEAKEKKQTAFENDWAVLFDEVCSVDVTVCNVEVQKAQRNKTDLSWAKRVSPALT